MPGVAALDTRAPPALWRLCPARRCVVAALSWEFSPFRGCLLCRVLVLFSLFRLRVCVSLLLVVLAVACLAGLFLPACGLLFVVRGLPLFLFALLPLLVGVVLWLLCLAFVLGALRLPRVLPLRPCCLLRLRRLFRFLFPSSVVFLSLLLLLLLLLLLPLGGGSCLGFLLCLVFLLLRLPVLSCCLALRLSGRRLRRGAVLLRRVCGVSRGLFVLLFCGLLRGFFRRLRGGFSLLRRLVGGRLRCLCRGGCVLWALFRVLSLSRGGLLFGLRLLGRSCLGGLLRCLRSLLRCRVLLRAGLSFLLCLRVLGVFAGCPFGGLVLFVLLLCALLCLSCSVCCCLRCFRFGSECWGLRPPFFYAYAGRKAERSRKKQRKSVYTIRAW